MAKSSARTLWIHYARRKWLKPSMENVAPSVVACRLWTIKMILVITIDSYGHRTDECGIFSPVLFSFRFAVIFVVSRSMWTTYLMRFNTSPTCIEYFEFFFFPSFCFYRKHLFQISFALICFWGGEKKMKYRIVWPSV